MKSLIGFFLYASLLLIYGCASRSTERFDHDIESGAKPWTHEPESKPSDDFSFAVIGDLNSGERERVFDIAIEQLNLLRPDLIMSVGDLIDGGTEDTTELRNQFDRFDSRVAKAKAPVFYAGGNHDLTNVVMRRFWEHRYGRRYYYFVYNNVLFLVLDSEDYNESRMQEIYVARAKAIEYLDSNHPELASKSAYYQMQERISGEISDEQSAYFEKVIEAHPNVRWTFMFMHKPVWQREEPGNLSRIEKALKSNSFTVINGHLHDYGYTARDGHDYITMGTTGGGQNPASATSFDHVLFISMRRDGPSIANLKLEGILNKEAHVPLDGDSLCFQASRCQTP